MLFNLAQYGPDNDVESFKMSFQAYNFGEDGDMLSINRFQGADCSSDAINVVEGGVTVRDIYGW